MSYSLIKKIRRLEEMWDAAPAARTDVRKPTTERVWVWEMPPSVLQAIFNLRKSLAQFSPLPRRRYVFGKRQRVRYLDLWEYSE